MWSAKRCHVCRCEDGHVQCSNQEQLCPPLSCPETEVLVQEGEGCPVCREQDYCARGHDCHPGRATCTNGIFNYSCHCNEGFKVELSAPVVMMDWWCSG